MSNAEDGPSLSEVQDILAQLPRELAGLLDRFSSTTPPYTPDYEGFSIAMERFLEPIFLYSDARFHSGVRDDTGASRTFYRIIARRKWLTEKALRLSQEKRGVEHIKSLKLYSSLKLLISWFGYGSEGSARMPIVCDMEYRFEQEVDPKRREEILQKALQILTDSSTAKYVQALAAAQAGRLNDAVAACEEGIRRFPGNTPLYELKARLLEKMAQQVLAAGLVEEPRDKALLVAQSLNRQVDKLREEFASGSLDTDELIERIERAIEVQVADIDVIKKFENSVREIFPQLAQLSSESQRFLCTGEYLLNHVPAELDHAPAAIEFCKAVEIETKKVVFRSFAEMLKKRTGRPNRTYENKKLLAYVFNGKHLTLGDMAFLLKVCVSTVQWERDEALCPLREYLVESQWCDSLPVLLTTQNVALYRNSAAHAGVYNLATAKTAKGWCYELLWIIHPNLDEASA